MQIERLDRLVLTVNDVEQTCAFYRDVLGMQVVEFEGGRKARRPRRQILNKLQRAESFKGIALLRGGGDCASTQFSLARWDRSDGGGRG